MKNAHCWDKGPGNKPKIDDTVINPALFFSTFHKLLQSKLLT